MNTKQFIKEAHKVYKNRYSYEDTEFVDDKTKVSITCSKHGTFEQTPKRFLSGYGCQKCASGIRGEQMRIDYANSFIERAIEVHSSRYNYDKTIVERQGQKVIITCCIHGDFEQAPREHLRGNGCQLCANIQRKNNNHGITGKPTTEQWVESAKKIHGDKFDYSLSEYVDYGTLISIGCPIHGQFTQYPAVHKRSYGCPSCGKDEQTRKNKINGVAKRLSLDEIERRIEEKHGDKITLISKESGEHVVLKCGVHGEYRSYLNNLSNCPLCSCQSSSQESRLKVELELLGVKVEVRIKIEGRFEIDLFLPEYDIGIEVNGVYWHSDHFVSSDYHYEKTMMAKRKGIQLLHFWEHELSRNWNLCISMIKSRIGFSKRLFARKLEIYEPSSNEAREFLSLNHLQGFCGSKVYVSLRSKRTNKIACLMSFSKPRFNKKYEWELVRFANHLGITVVGGASRLLSWFTKTYSPTSLVSYANLRYSKGDMYKQLGFSFVKRTKPNYIYVGKKQTITRYSAQKHKLKSLLGDAFDETDSETMNMMRNGFKKLFDCGNLLFELNTINR